MNRSRIFSQGIAIFLGAYLFLKFAFPYIAKLIAGTMVNLPIPGTLFLWYMILIAIAFFIYIASDQKTLDDFFFPILEAIRGRGGALHQLLFKIVFVLLPLFVGYQIYDSFVPKVVVPPSTRQQHPGMAGANAAPYAGMNNPFREPTKEMLARFVEEYENLPDQEGLEDALPRKVNTADLNERELRDLYFQRAVFEGRQLYHKNCRPCHGTGYDGAGPMATTFKLRPVAFIDSGTIATLVEDAVFWRVSEGGIGLPANATPWDSPMPKWKDELTEEERWKIVMAIYEDIGMKPRVLEMKVE